jgi:predicted alpha/beta superfamily hydrolase
LYARFIVHTVKPLIDSTYRAKPDRSNTAVMGSSMGGLISFLLVWWYPNVFSKAGCLSSVFSSDHGELFDQIEAEKNMPKDVKIYMDCGGIGNEASLKPGTDRMVALLQSKGYAEHKDFEWYYDPAAQHNEQAWAARLWRPLLFMFGTSE